ncbi:hypothetical protein BGW39_001931 [Mortierella sp. 14UC]|nr:hypothetical protein BGW39_001931 [Mortierella sp. 14UC]
MVVPTSPSVFDVINHPIKDTVLIVSCLLSKLVHKNDSCHNPLRDPITLFHSRAVPRISIEAYLTRILQYIPFTNEVLLNVLVFLDRIGGLEGMQMHQGGLLTPSSSNSTSSSQSNALSSAPGPIVASSFVVPVGGSNSSRVEDPEISCNLASSLSTSSSSAPRLPLSDNSTMTTKTASASTSAPAVMAPYSNSDSSLPMIQKRGREAEGEETETTTSTEAIYKKYKSEAAVSSSSSMPSPPLVDAASPFPEQSATTGNGFRVNSFNIHRLLITSLMIAAKFTSDLFYSNARYAKVGGLALQELNQLELEFLFTSKFELNVKVDELQRVANSLLLFRDRHMVPSSSLPIPNPVAIATPLSQHQSQTTMTMMVRQQHLQQQLHQQMQFQAQFQAQIQAAAAAQQVQVPVQIQAQALALKQQHQAGSLLSPPEEKLPWNETAVDTPTSAQNDHHQHSYYTQ